MVLPGPGVYLDIADFADFPDDAATGSSRRTHTD
jgi:hypothetical protein